MCIYIPNPNPITYPPETPTKKQQRQPPQVALVQFLEGNDGFRAAPMTLDDEGHMAKKVSKGEYGIDGQDMFELERTARRCR